MRLCGTLDFPMYWRIYMSNELWYKNGKRFTTPEYRAWQNMKNRCYNKRDKNYPYYGGRGIRVCDRWVDSVANFIADMGRRPSDDLTLDRIDPHKDYEPGNCRWATREVQSRNRPYATRKAWIVADALGVSVKTYYHYLWQIKNGHDYMSRERKDIVLDVMKRLGVTL